MYHYKLMSARHYASRTVLLEPGSDGLSPQPIQFVQRSDWFVGPCPSASESRLLVDMRNVQLFLEHYASWPAQLQGDRHWIGAADHLLFHVACTGAGHVLLGEAGAFTPFSLEEWREDLELEGPVCVIGAEYVTESQNIVIALLSGEIIMYPMGTSSAATPDTTPECVGCISEGIHVMAWSPDQELVVFGTGAGTLVTMTKEWDVLVENAILPGLDGLRAANVRWRPDGQYYAVASLGDGDGDDYRLALWDRNGGFKCEAGANAVQPRANPTGLPGPRPVCPGLAQTLEWFPDGSLLAFAEWRAAEGVSEIGFCIGNGDKHGAPCRLGKGRWAVQDLRWNPVNTMHSAVMAALVRPPEAEAVVRLYCRGNYHWYCKLQLAFEAPVRALAWSLDDSCVLGVASAEGFSRHHFVWAAQSSAHVVAVADGDVVKITDFSRGVVPPPSAHLHLQLPASQGVRALAVDAAAGPTALAAVLASSGDVFFFPSPSACLAGPTRPPLQHPILPVGRLAGGAVLRSARLLTLLPPFDAVAFAVAGAEAVSVLFYTPGAEAEVRHRVSLPTAGAVVGLAYDEGKRQLYWQCVGGAVWVVPVQGFVDCIAAGSSTLAGPRHPVVTLPETCPLMAILDGGAEGAPVEIAGLSTRHMLYVNSRTVATDSNAFAVFQKAFLLYTTFGNVLTMRLLHAAGGVAEGDPAAFQWTREVERGAQLICAVDPQFAQSTAVGSKSHPETKVVLQMPRGNLETVHPRPLMLTAIKGLLNRQDFGTAFGLLRRHRIDLNVIIDHDPCQFLRHVQRLVDSLTVPNLSLFIASIDDANVLGTTFPFYKHLPAARAPPSDDPPPTAAELTDPWSGLPKTSAVCKALRAVLDGLDRGRYVRCLMGTYAQQSPPAYDEALAVVQQMREADGAAPGAEGQSVWEAAIDHLVFLAQDVGAIYDAALGMYEFGLALAVAAKSQMDPKEYLPFLRHLQSLPVLEARFRVDLHLGRHKAALAHAAQCPGAAFEEQFFALATQHELYAHALRLLRVAEGLPEGEGERRAAMRQRLLVVYGEWLEGRQGAPSQAAYAYLEAGALSQALEAFVQSGEVGMAFATAHRLGTGPADTAALARRVADALVAQGRVDEAAAVVKGYCADPEGAVLLLTQARAWTAAMRLATECQRHDLIVTDIRSGVLADGEDRAQEMQDGLEQFRKFVARLAKLKESKAFQVLSTGDGQPMEADQMSLASLDSRASVDVRSLRTGYKSNSSSLASRSTQGSRSSRSSKASSSTPSKKDRKKLQLKEGGVYEESNLKRELHALIPKVAYLRHGIRDTVKMLLYFGCVAEAQRLQAHAAAFVEACQSQEGLMGEDLETMKGLELPEYVLPPAEWGTRIRALLQEIAANPWQMVVAEPGAV